MDIITLFIYLLFDSIKTNQEHKMNNLMLLIYNSLSIVYPFIDSKNSLLSWVLSMRS